MKIETNKKMIPKARKPFRILAGLMSLFAIFNIYSFAQGESYNIAILLPSIIFAFEFGSIAVRGDGLFLYKSNRYKKNQS